MERKGDVNSSSIIDLKAELFRKQEEFKKQKLQNQSKNVIRGKTVEKKTTIWSKKNKGVSERNSKDLEEKIEEANQFEKSRKCLEAKAKLYEKITQGNDIPEEDGSQVYLVDFQKKAIDKIVDDRDRRRREDEDERERQEEELLSRAVVPPPANEEEEWVDYVDGFGRSRRCMKKDLPQLVKQDQKTHQTDSEVKVDLRSAELMSNDMHKEMLRQKWEEEERAAMNQPIHYANVQYDEIRTHGVGFYQFSKDEESRKEQLDTLKDIRDKTKDERNRREKLKEKRQAILEARLAKVKKRKMQREGIIETPKDQEQVGEDDEIGPRLSEAVQEVKSEGKEPDQPEPVKKERVHLTRDESFRTHSSQREWDKGKEKLFPMSTEQKYFESRREERLSEFAPPSIYYKNDNVQKELKDTYSKSTKPTKVSEKQIEDFLSQERMNIQNNSGAESRTGSEEFQGTVHDTQRAPPPEIKLEQFRDIPLPESCGSSRVSNGNMNSWNQSDYQQNVVPHYSQTNLPPHPGTFYVPTHLPPPGYSEMASFPTLQQQWQQHNQPMGQYPSINSQNAAAPTTSYSVPSENFYNQSTESTAGPQTTGTTDIAVQPSVKPTRFNIVDPRLIQNEEVLESTPQNFTPLIEKDTEKA